MVTVASKRIGISTNTAHKWRHASKRKRPQDAAKYLITDPMGDEPDIWFHDAWDQAVAASCDVIESSLVELATGYREPIVHKGQFCYEVDPDKLLRMDEDGTPIYELKRDPNGLPIQAFIMKKDVRAQQTFLKARHRDYKEKVEMDITSGGKPLAVPEKVTDTAAFMAKFGRPLTDEEKDVLSKGGR
jgi:hypothetical protein